MKFVEKVNKNALLKNRVYSILNHKFEQIKKYSNEYLKKKIIASSYTLFVLFVLFAEKLNKKLRFYVNHKKLNVFIKRNRYFILLIYEIFAKIQNCKYFIQLNIIIVFNKLRMHLNNENLITFVIFFLRYTNIEC